LLCFCFVFVFVCVCVFGCYWLYSILLWFG
jgi:hypothetical protein